MILQSEKSNVLANAHLQTEADKQLSSLSRRDLPGYAASNVLKNSLKKSG